MAKRGKSSRKQRKVQRVKSERARAHGLPFREPEEPARRRSLPEERPLPPRKRSLGGPGRAAPRAGASSEGEEGPPSSAPPSGLLSRLAQRAASAPAGVKVAAVIAGLLLGAAILRAVLAGEEQDDAARTSEGRAKAPAKSSSDAKEVKGTPAPAATTRLDRELSAGDGISPLRLELLPGADSSATGPSPLLPGTVPVAPTGRAGLPAPRMLGSPAVPEAVARPRSVAPPPKVPVLPEAQPSARPPSPAAALSPPEVSPPSAPALSSPPREPSPPPGPESNPY